MKSADILVKFKLALKNYSKSYHDLISGIRVHNGQLLQHEKSSNHIHFEVRFPKQRDAAAFETVLKSSQAVGVKTGE